jgi:hypothetical protein
MSTGWMQVISGDALSQAIEDKVVSVTTRSTDGLVVGSETTKPRSTDG